MVYFKITMYYFEEAMKRIHIETMDKITTIIILTIEVLNPYESSTSHRIW